MKKPILYIIIFIVAAIVGIGLLTKTQQQTRFKIGTYVKITLTGLRYYDFDKAFDRIFSAIDKVDAVASLYNKGSEVNRLNSSASAKPFRVSGELWLLIKDSIALSEASDGYFDITIAPLVKLWKEYKDKGSIPPDKEVKEALALVGYENIVLSNAEKTVYFKSKGMEIDLSGLAKGYAVDAAIGEIKRLRFKSAIVDAGGDLYCLGKKSFFNMWRVGIINPRDRNRFIKILNLCNKAAATSGGYEQHFVYKGKDYTHLIDPKTGYPIESVFSSVTVLAPNCALADGIATAVSIGGSRIMADIKKAYKGVNIIVED